MLASRRIRLLLVLVLWIATVLALVLWLGGRQQHRLSIAAGPADSETFGLIVQQNSSDPVNVFLDKSTFTILDNDAATWSVTPASTNVTEGGSVTFTVTRSSSVGSQTVFVSTTQTEGFSNSGDYLWKQGIKANL